MPAAPLGWAAPAEGLRAGCTARADWLHTHAAALPRRARACRSQQTSTERASS